LTVGEAVVEQAEDALEKLKRKISDFHGYDELALEQYRALSFYLACRADEQMSLAMAAKVTCETFGHDAPRGLCQRCGLGIDVTKRDEDRARQRVAERDRWLEGRLAR
jgi:hypothetical protein